jgi:phosphopantothenoylcysteine decarboxylase/phosphopantothenate--cysteine ligase
MPGQDEGRHVVLGVGGSIAAFKAAKLASDLVKAGYEVRAVLTAGAARFVTPLTFEAITGRPAATSIWDEQPGTSRMGHLELAGWADVVAVAPASAGVLARLALGLTDDMLSALALACRAPLLLAPAMETGMYEHPATQEHMETLRGRGATVVGPERGRLASGAEGAGRMSEPEVILAEIEALLGRHRNMIALTVLVTAGPTYEALDAVRFIGNRSSGKMGYAIAAEAADRGAKVALISGPTALASPPGVEVVRVESSEEMRRAVMSRIEDVDVAVMAAAVADFRPEGRAEGKLKREDGLELTLVATPDIAAEAATAAPSAFHVGFALEASNAVPAAREKLRRKHQQLVVANLISAAHNPFGSDNNRVVFVTEDAEQELPKMPKQEVARALWDEVLRQLRR